MFSRNGDRRDVVRYAWPAGVAAAGLAWYAADSLRHRREGGHGYTLRGEVDVSEPSFLRAAEALTGAPVSYGNDVDLLVNGDQIFPAYLEAIRQAEETVNLLTYAYWKGDIAIDVAEALCDRANAGVECNVLIDAVGGAQMERRLVEQMREAGVTFCWFRPPKPYAVRRLQHRTHRKLLIVDGAVGFTGGVGIAEEWTGNAQDPHHWRDSHVRVHGPVVRGLQGAFAENWLEGTGNVLAGDRYLPELEEVEDGGPMQVMRSSATVGDTNAEALIYLALAAAKRSIELTSAYFVPRPAFTQALLEAADRGVEVRILVPGSGPAWARSTSTTAPSSSTTKWRCACRASASPASCTRRSSATRPCPSRSTRTAGVGARAASGRARRSRSSRGGSSSCRPAHR